MSLTTEGRLSKWFRSKKEPTSESPSMEELDEIYRRRFAGANRERFNRLWREIAQICEVSPLQLHEDDELLKLCPQPRWSPVNDKLDEVIYVMMRERSGTPTGKLRTVGELLDWILQEDNGLPRE